MKFSAESGPCPAHPDKPGLAKFVRMHARAREGETGPCPPNSKSQRNMSSLTVTHFSSAENFVFSFKTTDFHLQTIMCSQEVTYFVFLCKLLGVLFVLEMFCSRGVCGHTAPQANPT